MKDIAALPTNMGLTLWDALPVYVGVSIAVALLARVWLSAGLYVWYWYRRRLLDPAGLFYLILFYESLSIPYAVLALLTVATAGRRRSALTGDRLGRIPTLPLLNGFNSNTDNPPATPIRAIRTTLSDTVTQLLVAGGLAALVNIYGPRLPDGPLWLIVPVTGVLALGPNPGAAAIPAVASASTSGMPWIGVAWLALAFGVSWLQTARSLDTGSTKTVKEGRNVSVDP